MIRKRFALAIIAAAVVLGGCKTGPTLTKEQEQKARQTMAEDGELQPQDADKSAKDLRREYRQQGKSPVDSSVKTDEPVYEENLDLAKKEDFLTLVEGGVPDELKNTIEIRNYEFGITRIEELPEVKLDVYNRLDDKPVTFEIRTLFFRENDTVLDATEWVKATVPPRGKYNYRALAFSTYVTSEQVQIRLVKEGTSQK